MVYKCEATSITGFIQQLACNYLPHGYWFYVSGCIPEGKDASAVDQKLIEKYGIDVSRATRARKKQAGRANLHYLRHERFFLLLATHGQHRFFADEGDAVRDVRRVPIRFAGYSVTVRRGQYLKRGLGDKDIDPHADGRYRVRVRIASDKFIELKSYFRERAVRDCVDRLAAELHSIPFEAYAPVRQQLLRLVALVNSVRHTANQKPMTITAVRLKRCIVKPFGRDAGRDPELERAALPNGDNQSRNGERGEQAA